MASYTTNLNLLKKDPAADASDTFNIQTMLNDNWDKIDAAIGAAKSAEEYDASGTYAVGDYCTHDGKLYKCTTAITAAEAWTAAHWTETSVGAEIAAAYAALEAHTENTSNPHGVTPAQIGAAPMSHNHDASAITSGILSAARGGTGVSSLAALTAAMGGARIATGSYTGTGTNGSSSPNSLSFPFAPAVVFIVGNATNLFTYSGCPLILVKGRTSFFYMFPDMSQTDITPNFSGNAVSWFSISGPYVQQNESGKQYTYVAIG